MDANPYALWRVVFAAISLFAELVMPAGETGGEAVLKEPVAAEAMERIEECRPCGRLPRMFGDD